MSLHAHTLCPSGAPFGTWTSSVSCTFNWRYIIPFPPHVSHVFCTCWIIGPIRIVWILTPRPPQAEHCSTPFSLSITLRVRRSVRAEPLKICSRVTLSGCTIFSPFLTP